MDKFKPYRKAIVAALIAGLALLLKAMGDDVVTWAELVEIALAMLSGGGVTWLVPNTPVGAGANGSHRWPPDEPKES